MFEWSSHQGNSANSHKGYKHQAGKNSQSLSQTLVKRLWLWIDTALHYRQPLRRPNALFMLFIVKNAEQCFYLRDLLKRCSAIRSQQPQDNRGRYPSLSVNTTGLILLELDNGILVQSYPKKKAIFAFVRQPQCYGFYYVCLHTWNPDSSRILQKQTKQLQSNLCN